jgi:hypothetical protein
VFGFIGKIEEDAIDLIEGGSPDLLLAQGSKTFYYNTTKGKKTVQVELSNIRIPNTSFQQNPSYFSLDITKKIIEAGKFMDISVLDHLIIGHNKYLSLRDENLI